MVVVFDRGSTSGPVDKERGNLNKAELLRWYLTTLKLRELLEYDPLNHEGQGQSHPSDPQIQIKDESDAEKGPKSPKSEWIIVIREKLEQARQDGVAILRAKLCIYRVPQYLREGDDKAYIPQTVSLGPYHHGREQLQAMDRHKWRAVHQILKRNKQQINLYLDAVKELEGRARACYEGPITLSSNEFVEMMVVDGCFILELFRGAAHGFVNLGYSWKDPVFAKRGSVHSIRRDMIMLENQIPLFILERLLELGNQDQKGVLELVLQFFGPIAPTHEPSLGLSNTFDPLMPKCGFHCLDVFRQALLRRGPKPKARWIKRLLAWILYVFRQCLLRRGPQPKPRNRKRWSHACLVADKHRQQQLLHCVTELRKSGIKFKKRETDLFWDVEFKNGILWIPRLLIHDGTKSLFLNLIAFEQCHTGSRKDITSYIIFMDNLINSLEDVVYLHYCGIIEPLLGSDAEVVSLFNRLRHEVVFDMNDSYLSRLSEEVKQYNDRRWNTWKASLMHNYFSSPWKITSIVAAVVLLVLTFAQTLYGIYGFYRPPS